MLPSASFRAHVKYSLSYRISLESLRIAPGRHAVKSTLVDRPKKSHLLVARRHVRPSSAAQSTKMPRRRWTRKLLLLLLNAGGLRLHSERRCPTKGFSVWCGVRDASPGFLSSWCPLRCRQRVAVRLPTSAVDAALPAVAAERRAYSKEFFGVHNFLKSSCMM